MKIIFKYITCDRDNSLWLSTSIPIKVKQDGSWNSTGFIKHILLAEASNYCDRIPKWSDEEPTELHTHYINE